MSDDDNMAKAYLDAKDSSTLDNLRASIAGWREQMPLSNGAVFLINVATVAAGMALGYYYPDNYVMLAVGVILATSGVWGIVDGPVRRWAA